MSDTTSDLNEEIALFRRKFPMFSNEAIYPYDRVYLALIITQHLVDETLWPNPEDKQASMYWHARFLLTAHQLVLWDNANNADGTAAANTNSFVTGKSVGGVSVTYAAPSKVSSGVTGSDYDTTTYGREYLTLVKIFGAGCLTV